MPNEPAHRRKPPIFSWYFEDLAVAVLNILYWDAEGNWGVADKVLPGEGLERGK